MPIFRNFSDSLHSMRDEGLKVGRFRDFNAEIVYL